MFTDETIWALEASLPQSLCTQVYQKRVEIDQYKADQLAKAAAFRPLDVTSPTYALDVVLYEQAVNSVAVSVANYECSIWQCNPHLFEVHIRLMEVEHLKAERGERPGSAAGGLRLNTINPRLQHCMAPPPVHSPPANSMVRSHPALSMVSSSNASSGASSMLYSPCHSSSIGSMGEGYHQSDPVAMTAPSLHTKSHRSKDLTVPEPTSFLRESTLTGSAPGAKPTSMLKESSVPYFQTSSTQYVEQLRQRHFSQYMPDDNHSEMSGISHSTSNSASTTVSLEGPRFSPQHGSLFPPTSNTLAAVPEAPAQAQDPRGLDAPVWDIKSVDASSIDMLKDAEKVMALYKSLEPHARQELTQLLTESVKLKAAQVPQTPHTARLTEFSTPSIFSDYATSSMMTNYSAPTAKQAVLPAMTPERLQPLAQMQKLKSEMLKPRNEAKHDPRGSLDGHQALHRTSNGAPGTSSSGSLGLAPKKKSGFGKKLLKGAKAIWALGDAMWEDGMQHNARG